MKRRRRRHNPIGLLSAGERSLRRHNPLGKGDVALVALVGAVGVGGYFTWRHFTDIDLVPGVVSTKPGSRRLVLPKGAKWAIGGGSAGTTGLAVVSTPVGTSSPFSVTFSPSQSVAVAWSDASGMLQATTVTASAS